MLKCLVVKTLAIFEEVRCPTHVECRISCLFGNFL